MPEGATHTLSIPGSNPFLGDRAVVAKVLADMLEPIVEPGPEAVEALAKAVSILCGEDPAYQPLGPSWNAPGDESGLGNWIKGHMNGVPDGDGRKAVEYALGHLILHKCDAVAAVVLAGAEPEEMGRRLSSLIRSWACLMVGIPADMDEEEETGDEGGGEHA